eukprot:gnl/Dysnectes_brevis/5550_a8029_701.p1 GENE.gnl/Dysnectes_brevis/5550_a8029_701~~gnl/Dysnectes_brevis/5550_a8029_701.p1  ORF type:complete len:319 (-),score=14.35 gnl/Dysnectes_brevis/5550_a8029_701:57-1013(-)
MNHLEMQHGDKTTPHFTRAKHTRCYPEPSIDEVEALKTKGKYLKLSTNSNVIYSKVAHDHTTDDLMFTQSDINPKNQYALLGMMESIPIFISLVTGSTDADLSPLTYRSLAGIFSTNPCFVTLLAHAISIRTFMKKQKYCCYCGSSTRLSPTASHAICTNEGCKKEHYPAIAPAAIVLTTCTTADQQWILLIERMHTGVLTHVSGFVDLAETPESAAIREILEETGVTASHAHVILSKPFQPWPFGHQSALMVACEATVEPVMVDGVLVPPTPNPALHEVGGCKWLSRGDVQRLLGVEGAMAGYGSIARWMLEQWVDQ